jgi:hypothetical protein
MAVWAFRRLASPDAVATARAHHTASEPDADVLREWA